MKVNDYGKMLILAIALIGATFLAAIGTLDSAAVVAMYTLVIGYVTGNGVLAKRGEMQSPVLRSKDSEVTEDA